MKLHIDRVGHCGIRDENNTLIACTGDDGDEAESAAQVANAARLVACWNACEGLDTQAIEIADTFSTIMNRDGNEIRDLKTELASLRRDAERSKRRHDAALDFMSKAFRMLRPVTDEVILQRVDHFGEEYNQQLAAIDIELQLSPPTEKG